MGIATEGSSPALFGSGDSPNVILFNVDCDPSVYISAAVRMNAFGVAFNALADTLANSNVIGIVQGKPSATKCDIRVTGVTPDIFVGLDTTKEYFLSAVTSGLVSDTAPGGAGQVVVRVGQPFSSISFLVSKGARIQLAS